MKKNETGIRSALVEEFKSLVGFVLLRHEDIRTVGMPDASLTGYGNTSWMEFKHATPDFTSSGIQELTMLRLAAAGFARYVIWHEKADGTAKRTLIVHPKNLKTMEPEEWCVGFNHKWVVEYFRRRHQP
jgi:hypothetical protein